MSNRIVNENKSFRGSMVYLTGSEKEALRRAIDQYVSNVLYADDEKFIKFFRKYDEEALLTAEKKLKK